MNEKELNKLYTALINKGYTTDDLGDEGVFSSKMSDKNNRKELYDWVSANGDFNIGDYDTYEKRLTELPTQPQRPNLAERARPNVDTQTATPMMAPAISDQPAKSDTIRPVAPIQAPKVQTEEETQQQITRNDVARLTEEVDKALTESKGQSARQYAEQTTEAAKGGFWNAMKNAMTNTASAVSPTDMQVAARNQVWEGGQDKKLANDIDNYEAAEHALENAQRTIDEMDINAKNGTLREKMESSFVGGAYRGFGQKLFDARTWDMGATNMRDQMALNQALDAAENGTLTESQQKLLDAKAQELAAQAYFGSYVGRGYTAGSVTAESLPFMLEMMINPASTLGKSAASRLARYAINKFGAKVLRAGARVAGDVAGAATMTATTGAMRTTADALDRMSGGVTFDTDEAGHAVFAGRYEKPEDAATAFRKAFEATTIANFSEMLGNYFGPALDMAGDALAPIAKLVDKGVAKITPRAVSEFIEKVSASDLAKMVKKFEELSNWNGTIDEFNEELAGGILNALIVGDQTLDADPETGVFNLNNMIDTFLGVGLMGWALSSAKAVGYPVQKYQANRAMKNADVNAVNAFGDLETWDKVKSEVTAAQGEDRAVVIGNVLNDPNVTEDQKIAMLQYVSALQRKEGVSIGEQKRRENPNVPQEQVEVEQSFDNGAALETPQEKNDAQNMYEYQQQQMRQYFGLGEDGDVDAFLGDDPIAGLQRVAANDQEAGQVVLDYLNAKATVDGVLQRMSDDAEAKIAEADAIIASRTNRNNGLIQRVRLKNDKQAYVLSGDIVMTDDGDMVNVSKSSESLVVIDAITGKKEYTYPSNIAEVYQSVDAETERQTLREQVIDEYSQKLADDMNGTLAFMPGDNYTLVDDSGVQHNAQVVADNGDGTVAIIYDNEQEPTIATKTMVQEMSDTYNQLRLGQYLQEKKAQEIAIAEQEAQAEQPEVVAEEQQQQPVSALSQVPKDKKGKHDFNRVSPDIAWNAIVEMTGGAVDDALDTAKQMQKQSNDALKAAQKEKPKVGTDVESIIANKNAHKEKINGLQAIADHWANIVALGEQSAQPNEQTEEAVAENVVAEETAPVAEQIEVTPEVAPIAEEVVEPTIEEQATEQSEISNKPTENNADFIGRSLTSDEAKTVISAMQQNAEQVELMELTPENWIAQFGEDGILATPIGDVKMGENQYFKLAKKGRDGKLGMIKPTLLTPDVIIEEKSTAKDGQVTERDSSYVFVKAFTNDDGSRNYLFTSVTIRKEGKEVVISNQEKETPRIERLLKEGKLAYISKATLPSEPTNSTQGNQSTILGGAILSESKDTTTEPITQEVEQENLQEEQNEQQVDVENVEQTDVVAEQTIEETPAEEKTPAPLQLAMSNEEFDSLLASDNSEQIEAYLKELDQMLVIDENSPFVGEKALREEFKQVVEQYGGKDKVPAEVMDSFSARYQPYADLQRAIYDRKYALGEKLAQLNEQQTTNDKQKESEAKTAHKQTAFNGFLANKTALGASSAEKALSKKVKIEDKNYTIAEYVEQAVQSGTIELRTSEVPKYKGVSRRKWNQMDTAQQQAEQERIKNGGTTTEYYINDYNLGKVAYDYAQFLQTKATEQTPETVSENQPQSAVEPEWLQKVPTDGRNFMVYTKVAGENSYSATDLKTGQAVGLVYASLVKRDRLQSLVEELPKVLLEGAHFQIRDTNGKIYYSSEPIAPTKGKKKAATKLTALKTVSGAEVKVPINLYKYVSTDKTRAYTGVYFDPEGFVVATDGHNMIAVKHDVAEADAEKFISKAGDVASTIFNWRIASPKPNTEKPMNVDFVDVEKQIGGKAGDKFVVFEIDGQEVGFPPKAIHVLADFQRAFGGQAFVGDMTAGKAIVIRSGDNYAIALQTTRYADLSQAIHIPIEFEQATEQVEQPAAVSEQAQQPTEPTKQEPKPKRTADRKIEDFGEKIGGARKDVARAKLRDAAKLSIKDLEVIKDPDKILSRKAIIKYMQDGVMTEQDAISLLALNMVARQSGSKGFLMDKYRSAALQWEKGEDIEVAITEQDIETRLNALAERFRTMPNARERVKNDLEFLFLNPYNSYKATYEALNYPAVNRDLKGAFVRYGLTDGKYWVVKNVSASRGYPYSTMNEAIRRIQRDYPPVEVEDAKTKESSGSKEDRIGNIKIVKDDIGFYRLKSKNIPGAIYLSGRMRSRAEAEKYLQDNADMLIERESKMTEGLMGSNIGMVERTGVDYRNGRDITPEDFQKTFGFRGVEFGNWVPQAERQMYLNKAYDAIMDFCAIVGISPKAFSLGGRLSLAFGARGKSSAMAHYEPIKEVINLTRMKGAGSLAHEWFHALDNYIARSKSGDVTGMATERYDAVRQEISDIFRRLVSKMNSLAYSNRSKNAGEYWGEVVERVARLFQSYIYNQLTVTNAASPLLVRKDALFDETGQEIEDFAKSTWPYPSERENEEMKPYFDELFSTLQEKVDDQGNVVLFQRGDFPEMPNTEANRRAYNLVREKLQNAGIKVHEVSEEMANAMASLIGVEFATKRKSAPETASVQQEHQPTVVSSADGAKVLKDLDSAITEYENKSSHPKTLLGDIAKVLNAKKRGSNSQYATFEAVNGKVFTIRLANHNAKTSTFDNHNEDEGISIVVTAQDNTGITNNGNAHLVEFFYDAIKLRKADGKPLVEILKSIKQALYSGEYVDTTGLAEREEVNLSDAEYQIVYHGSGAKFDRFDHSFMGTGEGAQAYGYGTYVTQVEGIGKTYAKSVRNSSLSLSYKGVKVDTEGHYNPWRIILDMYNDSRGKLRDMRAKAERYEYMAEEDSPMKPVWREVVRILKDDVRAGDLAVAPTRVLYSIEIPDSNSEYLQWDGEVADDVVDRLRDELTEEYGEDVAFAANLKYGQTGQHLYQKIERALGSGKAASEFLNRNGFVGIEYPAQYQSGGRADNAKNYVIFNENDLKIIDRVELLQDSQGKIYGWAVGGEIYLTPDGLNANTAIHEYSHLWAEAMRQKDSKKWGEIKSQLKATPFWQQVIDDPNYENIRENEDAVASEVLARLSGNKGAERLANEAQRIIDAGNGNLMARVESSALVQHVKRLLRDFYAWVARNVFGVTNEATISQLSDMVVDDLLDEVVLDNIEGSPYEAQIADGQEDTDDGVRYRSDVDEVFDADFANLESVYQQLDKNDEQAMAEWRAKKKQVVEDYLGYMTEDLAFPATVYVYDHNDKESLDGAVRYVAEAVARKFGEDVEELYLPENKDALDELRNNLATSTAIGAMTNGAGRYNVGRGEKYNKPTNWLNAVSHENTHYLVEDTHTEQEFEAIWNEAVENEAPIVEIIQEKYADDTDAKKGEEVVAYAIGDYAGSMHTDKFVSFIKGENQISLADITSKLNKSLPLRNEIVIEVLNKLRDGNQRRKAETEVKIDRGNNEANREREAEGQDQARGERSPRRDSRATGRPGRDLTTISEVAEELAEQLHTPIRIIGDVSEINDDDLNTRRRKRSYKGWYDVSTGEVVVVAPNATSVTDVQRTVIHEVVAHNGLRELFGADFDTFLDNVYRNVDEPIRRAIANLAARKGWDFRVATEEYLASLAETTNFDEIEKQSWWQKIKDYFMDLLRKVGVKLAEPLTNDELRYILWRSYQMQKSKGAMAVAEDVVMQQKLGVGNFRTRQASVEQINAEFNKQLDSLTEENAREVILNVGMPSSLLRDYGIEDKPIRLYGAKLLSKIRKHGYKINDIKNLPLALRSPIAIFKGSEAGSFAILTELRIGDNNVLVTLSVGKGGHDVDFNIISSVYGKRGDSVTRWINNEKLLYVNKEKALDYLSVSAPIAEAQNNQELDSATKIVEEFDNNKYKASKNMPDNIRAREGSPTTLSEYEGEDIEADFADYDAGSMTFEESITNGLVNIAKENRENAELKMQAIYSIGGNLAKLRRAMRAQRKYDKAAIDSIIRIAKMAMNSGFFTDLSRSEITRLLNLVNAAASSRDITNQARLVVDMLLKHQVKEAKNIFKKLLKVRGSKVDDRGIVMQGKLDVDGQKMLATFKEAIKLDAKDLQEKINQALDEMGSDDNIVAANAAVQYQGLMLAKQYADEIKESEIEETEIKTEIASAKDAKLLSGDDLREYIESAEDAIRDNRLERIEAYRRMIAALGEGLNYSIVKAKEWREQQQERVQEIQHDANRDLQGIPTDEHVEIKHSKKWVNNGILQIFMQPLATFSEMLKYFGSKSADGKGFLYNRFMPALLKASDTEWKNSKAAKDELSNKLSEIMGKKMRIEDVFSMMRKMPTMTVKFMDGKEKKAFELPQGNLLYIYMVNKMNDGRMKLRNMGISEEYVAEIVKNIDPRFIKFADWVQSDFLNRKRNDYNEVHKRMFGASMAAIENYFPLIINELSISKVENVEEHSDNKARPSTITGSIIKRKRNAKPIDIINADAFNVVLDHIDQMEHWAAYAEFNRDLNALLSYKRFRNKVFNMSSARFGAGSELWKNFKNTAAIAAGVYQPQRSKADALLLNVAKGVTASKISFRLWTAVKQGLSLPAFAADTDVVGLAKAVAKNPADTWNWALDNLPTFAKRWQSRQAGDNRLRKTELDWSIFRDKAAEAAIRVGMTPNAFIDAWTCAFGARAVYETKRTKYLKQGYSESKAEEKALFDASVAFNETQQSSESAFLSPIQEDRTALSVGLTVFRNSNMAFARRVFTSLNDLKNRMRRGHKEESIERTKKQKMLEGLTEAQATKAATSEYNRQSLRDIVNLLVFGYVNKFLWELGSEAIYLLFGDDDDEKERILEDAAMISLTGPIEGLVGGDIAIEMLAMKLSGKSFYGYSFGSLPLVDDIKNTLSKIQSDKVAAANDVLNILISAGLGVNLQTLTDAVVAIIDAAEGDLDTSKEIALLLMRLAQVPQSQIDKIYIDELGINGQEAQEMDVEEMAKRYAKYKRMRSAPVTGFLYDEEGIEKVDKKHLKRFNKMIKERIEDDDDSLE